MKKQYQIANVQDTNILLHFVVPIQYNAGGGSATRLPARRSRGVKFSNRRQTNLHPLGDYKF